ncbi:uncharacterized protein LOC127279927 [Leptopilina boulardi]|uniref:uncharacterized protein LOC127279927 n=1 Tax=Leptopilina boulardi TaxID=63433 RepID=UPI0021F631FE|nr:uncharacterized protein LOC127279927 [Leptopilina boulardi]
MCLSIYFNLSLLLYIEVKMLPGEEAKVRELLLKGGLDEKTVSDFIVNSMDLFAIQHMDTNTLNILVPKLGQKIRFETQRKEWLESFDFGAETSTDVNSNIKTTSISYMNKLDYEEVPSIIFQEVENNSDLLNESVNAFKPLSGIITGEIDDNIEIIVEKHLKSADTSISKDFQPVKKKVKTYDLESVLKSSPDGTTVLKLYEQENKFLKDSIRDELVDCILQNELSDDMDKSIPRNRLQFLAEQIIQKFPTEEVTTYFEAYRSNKTKKLTCKGKLVWKYYNLRRKLSNCGAITKVKLSSINSEKPFTSVEINKSIAGSLCWLEQNRGNKSNWPQVLDHWRKTSKIRLNQLMYGEDVDNEVASTDGAVCANAKKLAAVSKSAKTIEKTKKQLTLHDYKVKYPVFQENRAYDLFEIDFFTLKPDVDPLALFSEWATLQSFIVEQVEKKIPGFLQQDDDKEMSNGEKTLHTLQNFCKILPIVNITGQRKGKKSWRPSHAEVNDAFFRVYRTFVEFDEVKEQRREKLKAAKLTLQPFVAVIGPFEDPLQFIVCIDEFFYDVQSALHAIDIAFKSFYALHTPYPPESKQIWLFLQKVVYGITETTDDHFTGVSTMIKEYQRFKAKFESPSAKQTCS